MIFFLQLFLYLFFIFASLISILGFGTLSSKFIKFDGFDFRFLHIEFINGIILISFVSIVFNFFYPLFDLYNYLVLLLGLVFFILFKKNKKIYKLFLLSLIALAVSYFVGLNDDFDYHFKTILNYKNLNLFEIEHQRRTSYNSNWLFISSIFTFDKYLQGLFVPTALLYSIVINDLFVARKIGERKNNFYLSVFSLFSIIFLVGVINNLKDFGTDVPGFLLLTLLFVNIFYFNLNKYYIIDEKIIFFLFLICNFALMVKITNSLVYLYLFVFLLFAFNFRKLFKFIYFISILPLLFWIFQNLNISGCIIWPIDFLCFYENENAKNELYLIESFAKGDINTSMSVGGFSWLSVWISNHSKKILEIYGIYIMFLIIPIFYLNFKKKIKLKLYNNFLSFYKNSNLAKGFIIVTLLCNIIWFLYYPAYRFGLFYNLSLIFFLILPFWKNIFLEKAYYKIVSNRLIVIAVLFFIFENTTRIFEYNDRYGDIWPPIINNSVFLNK